MDLPACASTRTFNPDELPEDQSRPLLDLLDQMDFDGLPENSTTGSAMPDQFTYTITVVTSQGERTMVLGDTSAPDEMRELMRMLDRIARKQRQIDVFDIRIVDFR